MTTAWPTLTRAALISTTLMLGACGGGNEPAPPSLQTPPAQAAAPRPTMQASSNGPRISGNVATAVQVFQALYGQAPSYPQLVTYTTQAANGPTFAANLVSSYSQTSDANLALLLLKNLGITPSTVTAVNAKGQSEYTLLAEALPQLLAIYGPAWRGQIIYNVTTLLAGLEADATYGGAAITYNNQALANYGYSTTATNTSPATVQVATANAGPSRSVLASASVTLDASASSAAPGKTLSYSWTLTAKPTGSSAVLTNASAASASLLPDVVGTYVVSLTVNDGTVTSSPVSVRLASAYVPDTGVNASQCYASGSDTLVSCTSAGALALNSAQDGMIGRDVSSASSSDGKLGFSFATVGNYASTECIKDNLTGLYWEGKPASGVRAYTNTYSNAGDSSASDASTYVTAVNAAALCGFSDWRLPTRDELQGLVDYALVNPNANLDVTWFPNTLLSSYWSATAYVGASTKAWYVSFANGSVSSGARSGKQALRLVR